MSKAFLSSSSSHSTITETSCDFYPDNSNQARERNLVFFSRKNKRSCYQKNNKIESSIKLHPRPFLMSYFDEADSENREEKKI